MAPTFTYLTNDPKFSDYRPVFDPTGGYVLFERTLVKGKDTRLFLLDITTGVANPFIQKNGGNPPDVQTRPDWQWDLNQVAFASNDGVYIIDGSGDFSTAKSIGGGASLIYPSWFPAANQFNGPSLALMATGIGPNGMPGPYTVIYDGGSDTFTDPITDGQLIYAGMPSVNQVYPTLIAFAGQLNAGGPYSQITNQIWLNVLSPNGTMQVQVDAGQGRSPWWSPDGQTIAFESNRDDPAGLNYGIYTISGPTWEVVQIPGSDVCGQHPKFSPDGTRIVWP